MQLFENLEKIQRPFTNAVITIGNFDGLHLGHQALFQSVTDKARELGGAAVAMTFDPHPLRVLKGNGFPPLITIHEQKTELIEATGVDVLIAVPFTREFASLTAREFVEDVLVRRIGMKAIVVGKDYSFGKNRVGNIDLLRTFSEELGFQVITPDWIHSSEDLPNRISSTRIRESVMAGEIDAAREMLGRHYQVRGHVVTGRDRGGKLLGFPTANINLKDELCPKSGVYAVTVELGAKKHQGVANIGYSPTFDDHEFTVEVHILDFDDDIYGEKIRVNFIHRIRAEKKFSGIDELSAQIGKDIDTGRKILAPLFSGE
ncbi:MAG: bifunctional riboflavin kinase/FAD synthetase [Desulfobacterales bacterium]|nr:bifunctional riboflavin kinase/FAD synthetase [Desulfobacterales bacterium]